MSDSQRIRGLGGIKPTRMPASAVREISEREAEERLGIGSAKDNSQREKQDSTPASTQANTDTNILAGVTASNTTSLLSNLPESLLRKKPKQVTVSRTFRLPLELADELEKIARIHDLPMVTILAEALQIHLARFPR